MVSCCVSELVHLWEKKLQSVEKNICLLERRIVSVNSCVKVYELEMRNKKTGCS